MQTYDREARRLLTGARPGDAGDVTVESEPSASWLRRFSRRLPTPAALAVLTGNPIVGFASVGEGGGHPAAAIGRGAVEGPWAGLAAIEVAPGAPATCTPSRSYQIERRSRGAICVLPQGDGGQSAPRAHAASAVAGTATSLVTRWPGTERYLNPEGRNGDRGRTRPLDQVGEGRSRTALRSVRIRRRVASRHDARRSRAVTASADRHRHLPWWPDAVPLRPPWIYPRQRRVDSAQDSFRVALRTQFDVSQPRT